MDKKQILEVKMINNTQYEIQQNDSNNSDIQYDEIDKAANTLSCNKQNISSITLNRTVSDGDSEIIEEIREDGLNNLSQPTNKIQKTSSNVQNNSIKKVEKADDETIINMLDLIRNTPWILDNLPGNNF